MITVDMSSPEGVTLAAAGKYCQENVQVVPTFDFAESARRWDITVTTPITSNTTPIVTDDWLKQHRSDNNLVVCLMAKGDYTTTEHDTFVLAINTNTPLTPTAWGDGQAYGVGVRARGTSSSITTYGAGRRLDYNGNPYAMKLKILDTGALCAVVSATYAINAGEYCVMAWLL